MVQRFFALLEYIDRDDDDIAELMPSAAANKKLKALLEQLRCVESVSKSIQSATVSTRDVRTLFDGLIAMFPQLERYLGTYDLISLCGHVLM
jgi:hypothetical protein